MGEDDKQSTPLKDKCPAKTEKTGIIRYIIIRVRRIWPLKYVFKVLKKLGSFVGVSETVETVGSADQKSPSHRRFVSGRKRIGRLTRLLISIAPQSLQCALGYHSETIGKNTASEEIKKSPLKPCGKGSKRKQDDVDIEEQHSWVTFMTEDLPEEDQDDDPTYEPSHSETDSEEHHSKNDTESDLEVEEKDGVVMLKEEPKEAEESTTKNEPVHENNQQAIEEQQPNNEVPQPNSSAGKLTP
ncbi:uncharacterized protein O3C94_000025 [Discoglossus pictus]